MREAKVPRDVRSENPVKLRQVREKDWSQQVEHMQVQNWTGPGIKSIKRPYQHATPVANVIWKPLMSR